MDYNDKLVLEKLDKSNYEAFINR